MKCLVAAALALLTVLLVLPAQATITNLRGVQDAVKSKYVNAGSATFSCFDGQKSIPDSFVNDDYCDCNDGSDEPGTAACSTNLQIPTAWKFQCSSEIFKKELLHSRVNDRICDCCDGSDEFTTGMVCPNTCSQAAEREGREAREREARTAAGLKARAQLVETAKIRRADIKRQLLEESESLALIERAVAAAESTKILHETTEAAERAEIKRKSEAEHEIWKQEKAKRDQEKAEAAAAAPAPPAAAAVEVDATEKKDTTSTVICTKWRQTKDCRGDGDREPTDDRDCAYAIPDGWSGYCECVDTESGEEVLHRFDCGHKRLTCDYVCAHDGDEPSIDVADPAGSTDAVAKEETFKVDDGTSHENEVARDARRKYTEENSKKIAGENKIKELEKDLSRDFGPDDAFLPMNGECFDLEEREYTYKVCPFKDVQQIKKGSGYGPNMGRFKGFGEQSYSLWGSKSDYAHMLFTEGESCWGGPARSTDVHLVCGETTKVVRVEEPSMCTYKMIVETPAVCE